MMGRRDRYREIVFGVLWVVLAIFLFAGCGGSGGSSSGTASPLSGVFVDSPVQGLEYTTDSLAGKTDAAGRFNYYEGETIRFSLGGLQIGDALKARPTVTVVDLVTGATDVANPKVQNIAAFLQSLDTGGDLSARIVIPDSAITAMSNLKTQGKTINFDAEPNAFNADSNALSAVLASGNTQICNPAAAQAHVNWQLASLLASYAGNYSGNLSGDDAGAWQITIDSTGIISGSLSGNSGQDYLQGHVSANGTVNMASSSGDATFTGTLDTSGNMKGTWSLSSLNRKGSFNGAKQTGGIPQTTAGSTITETTVPTTVVTTAGTTTTTVHATVVTTTSITPTTSTTVVPTSTSTSITATTTVPPPQ